MRVATETNRAQAPLSRKKAALVNKKKYQAKFGPRPTKVVYDDDGEVGCKHNRQRLTWHGLRPALHRQLTGVMWGCVLCCCANQAHDFYEFDDDRRLSKQQLAEAAQVSGVGELGGLRHMRPPMQGAHR